MTVEELHRKLAEDGYRNKLPYARVTSNHTGPVSVARKAEAYATEEARLHAEFLADLESAYETASNPKKDMLFRHAWDLGHSAGFSDVAGYYGDLVELIR